MHFVDRSSRSLNWRSILPHLIRVNFVFAAVLNIPWTSKTHPLCVSAETSFALAALLVPVGIDCVRLALQRDPAAIPLSLVPILFGVQQLCEGFVWLGIDRNNAALIQSAALFYLFFALAFWLFWIPFSAGFLVTEENHKLVGLLAVLGLAGGMALYLPLLLNPGLLVVTVVEHSLEYNIARAPALALIPQLAWHLAYLVVIALPLALLTGQRKGMLSYSVALVISAVISHAYFWYAFASVWCLFAAISSLMLVYAFHQLPLPKRAISILPPKIPQRLITLRDQ
jgi:hypothetical protein